MNIRSLILAISIIGLSTVLHAQTDTTKVRSRYSMSSVMIGVGSINVYDTYLSPVEFSGWQAHLLYERTRNLSIGHSGRWQEQSLLRFQASHPTNRSGTGRYTEGTINLNYGWFYRTQPAPTLSLWVGPQLDLHTGALYYNRNSNNPAQAQVYGTVDASALAIWKFNIRRLPLVARYQLNLPLIGAKFSPKYGESYYEIFVVGNRTNHVSLITPHNAFSVRQLLTIDIPTGICTLRAGYLFDMQQSVLNHIRYHSYSHALLLGVTRSFYLLKGRRSGIFHPQYPAY